MIKPTRARLADSKTRFPRNSPNDGEPTAPRWRKLLPGTANRLLAATAGCVLALSAVAGAAYAVVSAFTDVGDDHEHAAEISAAHQIGVFNGYGDGTFRPDGKLTQRQAENVIWRILSWHGTDDDGDFEITRADAAVLAMTGLCGLDVDRIPGCAAVEDRDEQAAYDRGYHAGRRAAHERGPYGWRLGGEIAGDAYERCGRVAPVWFSDDLTEGEWRTLPREEDSLLGDLDNREWTQAYALAYESGLVCVIKKLVVTHYLLGSDYSAIGSFTTFCSAPIDGTAKRLQHLPLSDPHGMHAAWGHLGYSAAAVQVTGSAAAEALWQTALAGEKPPRHGWADDYNPVACLRQGDPL